MLNYNLEPLQIYKKLSCHSLNAVKVSTHKESALQFCVDIVALQKSKKLEILARNLPNGEAAQVVMVKQGMWPELRSLIVVENSPHCFKKFLVKA